MATQTRTAFTFVVAGALLAAFGIVQGFGEAASGVTAGSTPMQRFAAMVAGGYEAGASRKSKDLVIADCLELPGTPLVQAQPALRREAFARQCLEAARAAVAEMPTYSAGWLALAAAAADLGGLEELSTALVASQRTGADVHWLGERRIDLAARHAQHLDATASEAYRLDLRSLFASAGGIEVLATRYVAYPAERPAILSLAETATGETQQKFLGRVQDLSDKAGDDR